MTQSHKIRILKNHVKTYDCRDFTIFYDFDAILLEFSLLLDCAMDLD